MLEEYAQIISTDRELAIVETRRRTACGSCGSQDSCGTSVLSKVFSNRTARMQAHNPIGAEVGDMVVIGIPEDAFLKGVLLSYGMPLLALIVGAALGEYLASIWGTLSSESLSIIGGVAGFASGLFVLRRFSRQLGRNRKFQPLILRKVQQELRL